EDVLRRPGALPAHADRTLRLDDGGGSDSGTGDSRTFKELTTRITPSFGFIGHCWFPPISRGEDEPAVEDLSRAIAAGSRGRDGTRDGKREGIRDRDLLEAIEAAGGAAMARAHVG